MQVLTFAIRVLSRFNFLTKQGFISNVQIDSILKSVAGWVLGGLLFKVAIFVLGWLLHSKFWW